jgi:hypothetical protein
VLPAGLANAQQLDFDLDTWMDQQVDQHIERTGIFAADQMLWCDPIPRCETIPLKAIHGDSGSATVIVVVGGSGSRREIEFLRKQVELLRAAGGEVLQAAGLGYDFAIALRSRLGS